jgi:hypothetical protein
MASPGELRQEPIQIRNELAALRVIAGPEPRELEHQKAHLRTNRFAGQQERVREKLSVQKVGIGLPGLVAEPIQFGKFLIVTASVTLKPKRKSEGTSAPNRSRYCVVGNV